MRKRNTIGLAICLSALVGVVFAAAIISNVFEGLIPHVSIPEPIHIVASTPENITIGTPFYMYFNVTNPNDLTIYSRLHINFTLNGAPSVTTSSMSYFWTETTFLFTGGSGTCTIGVSGNTWMFNAPQEWPDWFIKIPTGTNNYKMQFKVDVQCDSINYKVWFAS